MAVKLNSNGKTYGKSYGDWIYWMTTNIDVIYVDVAVHYRDGSTNAASIHIFQQCAGNTYNHDSAAIITKEEFEIRYFKVLNVINSVL